MSRLHPVAAAVARRIADDLDRGAEALELDRGNRLFREIEVRAEEHLGRIAALLDRGEIDVGARIRKCPDEPEAVPVERRLGIGVYPVAADPFHWAHLLIALDAIGRFTLDRVVFIVAGIDRRKPTLTENQDHRHAMAAQVLSICAPLTEYSRIAYGTDLHGEGNIFRLLALNPRQKIRAYYMVGADHYHRTNPKGQADTIQKLEDNIRGRIHGFNPRLHSVAPMFIERGERERTIDTTLDVEFLPAVTFGASSTQIRGGDFSIMPYTAYAYACRHGLYGVKA